MKKELKRDKGFEKKIFAYALANALSHEGRAKANAVLPKLFQEGLKKEQIKEIMPLIQKTINKINSMNIEEQKKEFEKLSTLVKKREEREGLPPLLNAQKGRVVMRFAPFPSGPLHLGNARTLILNDEYCRQYKGKLLLVIDDTIGSKKKQILPEAYKLIPESINWLGVKYQKPIIYKSDRLEIYYKYAEQLIKKGKAYVCFCDPDIMHKNRAAGLSCEHRTADIEETLGYWKKMLQGKYEEGKAILRIKTDMKHKNPAFRDRVLFRISNREHPKTKKQYKVWPMLDFSWAIDDHLLGMTHVLRGKELMIESDMEKYIWKIFGWPSPNLIHMGLFQIEGVKISKSKSREEVLSGKYFGWDDPRTWSVQSLKRRGFRAEAIRNFCLNLGLTLAEITVPIDALYKENKKIVESSNRYFFIANPVKVKIKSAPKLKAKLYLHPNYHEKGSRNFTTNQEFWLAKDDYKKIVNGVSYRLMNLFNFIKNKDFEFISQKRDPKLKTKIMHWLPADEKQIIKTEILMPDGKIIKGFAEKAVSKLKIGAIIQFERFGFCCFDKKEKDKAVFWFSNK